MRNRVRTSLEFTLKSDRFQEVTAQIHTSGIRSGNACELPTLCGLAHAGLPGLIWSESELVYRSLRLGLLTKMRQQRALPMQLLRRQLEPEPR